MRFRKRLSAAFLAIVMMVSSIQIPGGTSYAAEIVDSSIESGQDASILAVEETEEDTGMVGSESQPDDEDAVLDDDSLSGDDSQTGDENPSGDDSQTGDENPSGDDSRTDDENDPDEGLVSGDDAEEPVLSVDTEETGTEEIKVVEAKIEGAYQFGDAPSTQGGISLFSVSAYDNSVEDYVYQQMLKREGIIDISAYGIPLETAENLISGVLNEHPDLYFVGNSINYSYGSDGIVSNLMVLYDTSYDDAAFRAFKENTEAALACVTDDMSDDAKAAALHDWLAVNVEYDYDNYNADSVPEESYNAYGALVNGIAVCNGYALAYKYLLNQVGIECYMVTSESLNHAWNMVKLYGEYYHVDVTWDDPVRDMVGRVFHDNLFHSDTNFGKHEDWVVTSGSNTVDYEATDTKYESAFWAGFDAPLVFDGSDCYYIEDGKVNKGNFSNITGTGTKVVDIGKEWKIWSGDLGLDMRETYSGLYMIKDRLFYNDWDSIYSIKLDGTGKKTEYTPEKTGKNQIYYSAYRRGKVIYALQSSPNLFLKQNVLVAEINIGGDEPDPPVETKEGYNVDNLTDSALAEYSFTNVLDSNGKTMPKADGKPVVLMFYNSSNTGTNGVSTFKDIADHAGYFKTDADSVDFYGFDIRFGKTEEIIKNYTESNGLSGTDVLNWIYVPNAEPFKDHYYYQIKGQSSVTGSTYPLMIYIDKKNKIQYATEGNMTAEEILVNLRQYCGYTQYYINYEMDGGDNNEDNPSMYTGGEEVILKNPPYRDGYRFDGWYKDNEYTDKVTKIPVGSMNDVTLYAKWVEGAYDLANLEQEYTTVDGTKVSSTADGKPKLLLFFRMDQQEGLYVTTLGSISDELEEPEDPGHALEGVDIYAIDIGNATKSQLKEFSEAYAENITFCYDTNGVYKEYMDAYMSAPGFDADYYKHFAAIRDFKCYIDKDNRLQYVDPDFNHCWISNIMEALQEYCQYPPYVTYSIQYEMNGGINNSNNPSSYNSEMKTITLEAPTKEGYIFAGWYQDEKFTKKVTQIFKGSTGNITLYAKWKRGLDAANLEYTYRALGGKTVSSAANSKPKVLLFYMPDPPRGHQMHQVISEHIKDFDGVDICAIATHADEKAVTAYKKQYGCDGITYCYDTYYQISGKDYSYNAAQMLKYVKISDPYAKGAAYPTIVYIDAENRVQHVVDQADQSWTEVLEDLRDYCGYDRYLINYQLDGGKNNSENPYTYTKDTETIILNNPSKGTHRFDGWYTDPECEPEQKVTEIPKGSSGDITLYAKWTKTGAGLGLDNLDYTFNAVDDTTFSSAVENGRPRVLIFFSSSCLNSAYTLLNIKEAKEELDGIDIYKIECTKQSKDTVTEIQETYEFEKGTVSYNTSTYNSNAMLAYLVKAKITERPVQFPVICYIDANNHLEWVTMDKETASADTIKANLKTYCNYPPELEAVYNINYELDGGTNHEDNPDTYTAETETIVLKDASKTRFIFEGWYEDAEFTRPIKEITQGRTGDITLYAKWSAKEDGALGIDNLEQTYKGLDGKTLGSGADDKPKLLVFFMADDTASKNTFNNITQSIDRLGGVDIYAIEIGMADRGKVTTFKGTYGCDEITFAYEDWDLSNYDKAAAYMEMAGLSGMHLPLICYIDKDNKLQWVTENEQTGDGVLENLKKYCNYPPQEQETYHITYELDGGTNSSENPATYTISTETITLKDATKEGYTFEGWYKDVEFTESEKVTEIVTGSTGDITLYAKWVKVSSEMKTYQITYDLDGGTNNIDNPDTYTSETDTFVLKDAVKEGYVFGGWYKDSKFLDQVTKIEQGSVGDITLYAKWKAKGYGENLYQTYTALDGTELSSMADGKPKVLVFFIYNSTRHACMNTMSNIRDNIDELEGVDIYAIECNKGTKDLVGEFQNVYGTDKIPFAYDTTGTVNKPGMQAYEMLATGKNVSTYKYPLICYIDADNNFQLLTTDESSTEDILDNLQKYCGYVSQKGVYSITYVLNGGINNSGNPAVYTSDTESITLKDPIKEGSTFEGWYKDSKFTEKVTTIVKGSEGDITLYAKWRLTETGNENDREDLSEIGGTIANIKAKVYDGLEYEPVLKVTVMENGKKKTLIEGADYSVEYTNNVEAGTGTVYVRGEGIYKGKIPKEFTINPKPIKKLKVITGNVAGNISLGSSLDNYVYVYDGRKRLVRGVDYDLEINQSSKKAINVTIIAKQNSNYTGNRTAKLTVYDGESAENIINPDNIIIEGKAFYEEYVTEYTGKALKPNVTVQVGNTTLEKKNYKVSYQNNKDAGTAYVIVTGKGEYKGKAVLPFTISSKQPVLTITNNIKDKTYNGKLQKPSVTVKAGTVKLKKNKDYKVTYSSNLHAGTATVTVTGRGNYIGSVEKTFQINKLDIKKVSVKGIKNGLKVYHGTRLLRENIDYTSEYGAEKGKNKIEVTITATLNSDFKGSVKKTVKTQ